MKASELLQATYNFLDSPKKWTKGVYARDAHGGPTLIRNPNTVCWCAAGALHKMCRNNDNTDVTIITQAFHYLSEDAKKYGFESIGKANDHPATTFSMVRRALKRAITQAEKERY